MACTSTSAVLTAWAILAAHSAPPAEGVRVTPSERRRPAEDGGGGDASPRSLRRNLAAAASSPPPTSPDAHTVTGLPLLSDDGGHMPETFAGHLPACEDGHKKLFYWLVSPPEGAAAADDPDVPLLIWLNGGPGCSSMEGFFLENGPVRFDLGDGGRWRLLPHPQSWHTAPAYVLYIDQPVGTGLSFTTGSDYCKSDEEVNRDFVYFLEEFLLLHGDKFLTVDGGSSPPRMRRPLFFSGESHAGHYIPSMIDRILSRRSRGEPVRVDVSVSGAAIGNGWTDPYHQYSAADAAYGAGLIDLAQKAHLDSMEGTCRESLDAGRFNARVCFDLLDDITAQSHGAGSSTRAISYDVSKYEPRGARTFPPGHGLIEAYLGGGPPPPSGEWDADHLDVLGALHAVESVDLAGQKYKGCANPPYGALVHQDGLGVVPEVTRILDRPGGVRLLFFNGMNDLVCNHVRNEVALRELPWGRAGDWALAPRYAWHLEKDRPPAGYVQELDNLLFIKIPNSGHMVPMDQPIISLEMIRTFMYNGSFQSNVQDIERENPVESSC